MYGGAPCVFLTCERSSARHEQRNSQKGQVDGEGEGPAVAWLRSWTASRELILKNKTNQDFDFQCFNWDWDNLKNVFEMFWMNLRWNEWIWDEFETILMNLRWFEWFWYYFDALNVFEMKWMIFRSIWMNLRCFEWIWDDMNELEKMLMLWMNLNDF